MTNNRGSRSEESSSNPCGIFNDELNLNKVNEENQKKCIDSRIKDFSEDAFGHLRDAGTSDIIEYLIKISIEQIVDSYQMKPGEAEYLIKTIWKDDYQDLLDRLKEINLIKKTFLLR